jgi:hypothetical protein
MARARQPRSRRRLEPLVQLVDLRDQVVDALGGVLSALVQLAQALVALEEPSAQGFVLGPQRAVAGDQTLDGPLQTLQSARGLPLGGRAVRLLR